MFNFQHSQITQNEFDKFAKQLIKYSSLYATSKFDAVKVSSSLHPSIETRRNFQKAKSKQSTNSLT